MRLPTRLDVNCSIKNKLNLFQIVCNYGVHYPPCDPFCVGTYSIWGKEGNIEVYAINCSWRFPMTQCYFIDNEVWFHFGAWKSTIYETIACILGKWHCQLDAIFQILLHIWFVIGDHVLVGFKLDRFTGRAQWELMAVIAQCTVGKGFCWV